MISLMFSAMCCSAFCCIGPCLVQCFYSDISSSVHQPVDGCVCKCLRAHAHILDRESEVEIQMWNTSGGLARKVHMYYSVWLQLQLDVTEFTKERGETTDVT